MSGGDEISEKMVNKTLETKADFSLLQLMQRACLSSRVKKWVQSQQRFRVNTRNEGEA